LITQHSFFDIKVPLICGAMYPCSNPELVAAASEAGGLGVIQPMSLTYVYGYDFREGLKYIKSLTTRPVGLNLILAGSKKYQARNREWLQIALEEGIRFFVTALGKPDWVVKLAHKHEALVYHDVVKRLHAQKAYDCEVDGFICVNNQAGGHSGSLNPETLIDDIGSFNKPMVCAGGVGDGATFKQMLNLGYTAVQAGTRFIASKECLAHQKYKTAILKAKAKDIILTDKISGVPVAVINNPDLQKIGSRASWLARKLLSHNKTKRWMRTFYSLQSRWKLKRTNVSGGSYQDYYLAGKSVETIDSVKTVAEIYKEFAEAKSTPG